MRIIKLNLRRYFYLTSELFNIVENINKIKLILTISHNSLHNYWPLTNIHTVVSHSTVFYCFYQQDQIKPYEIYIKVNLELFETRKI